MTLFDFYRRTSPYRCRPWMVHITGRVRGNALTVTASDPFYLESVMGSIITYHKDHFAGEVWRRCKSVFRPTRRKKHIWYSQACNRYGEQYA